MGRRELLAKGMEHNVYREPSSDSVTKVPRFYNRLILRWFFHGPWKVIDEIKEAAREAARTDGRVQIPHTTILFTKDAYVMKQRYIREDHSVPDVTAVFEAENLPPRLVFRSITGGKNFISENGVIYIIDPTDNPFYRLQNKIGLVPEERIRKLSVKTKRYLTNGKKKK
jgi:hypothetical protein